MDPLATEKTYMRKHLDELASAHPGKFLLIKGDQVHGAFETYKQGLSRGRNSSVPVHFWSARYCKPTTRSP